jgi:iron complex transport system substrate-binding protein
MAAIKDLRITCLIPSATDICVALGLSESIVGVTHECDRSQLPSTVRVVTADLVKASTSSQAEIHQRVLDQQNSSSDEDSCESIPSLYPILRNEFEAASTTIVITQDLCGVCAPTSASVAAMFMRENSDNKPQIVTLSPNSLTDIKDSILTVAKACGISNRGQEKAREFQQDLDQIKSIVSKASVSRPRMLLLEWLDPPFDGGHWIPEMMNYAGVECIDSSKEATVQNSSAPRKSKALPWIHVQSFPMDIILVACCGFDLSRNLKDAIGAREKLAACQASSVFATNGDLYFARPGPKLIIGTAIMALCAHRQQPLITQEIMNLPFMRGLDPALLFLMVDLAVSEPPTPASEPSLSVPDIEDSVTLHNRACEAGESFYSDPETGYQVFTEYAHKLRGKCCGSGCRHCPYAHVNVKDKAAKIQQPALIYHGEDDHMLSLKHGHVRVLFFSGGKDSFLAIRTQAREATTKGPFGLCLLTTFDATSRIIAHQDTTIDRVERQARHLGIALVGVPMHRASSETYVDRAKKGLDVLESFLGAKVSALVFGDLHLEHVTDWRRDNLGVLATN